MRGMPWAVYAWPGLPELSRRGSWTGLAVALAAAALLNVALLASFVWPDLLARELRIICWALVAVAWGFSAGFSAWLRRREAARRADAAGDLFREALDGYLKGNWIDAERLLSRLLRRDGRDAEARLMLATLLRHTKRYDEATRQLNLLVRLDGAEGWAEEIRREGELLTEARRHNMTTPSPAHTGEASHGDC